MLLPWGAFRRWTPTRKAIDMEVETPQSSAMQAVAELLIHLQEASEQAESVEQDTWGELQSS